jgi:long-chain acyl-CoA synthetase
MSNTITRAFECFEHQLRHYPRPDSLAMKQGGKWVVFSSQEVWDISRRLALGLLSLGIGHGDKVAIVSPNRPEWNFADLAIQQIGAVSVPIYPTASSEDYAYIFADAEVKVIFAANQELYDKCVTATRGLAASHIYTFEQIEGLPYWHQLTKAGEAKDFAELDALKASIKEQDLLTLIYTSGTTGKPKGVMLSHKNVVSNTLAVKKSIGGVLDFGKSKSLSFLPLCHIYERTGVYFYMTSGVGVYYAESMDTIAANLQEVCPDIFNTVPRLLEKVYAKIVAKGHELTGVKKSLFFWALNLGLRYEPNKPMGAWYDFQLKLANKLIFSKWRAALGGNIKLISSGAAALQPRLARVFWSAGIPICEGYGLTETSPVITATRPDAQQVRIGCVGSLVEGVEIKIAEDGEILCRGENVMQGYYKQPEMTAEVLRNGWFHTGDIGEIVEGQYLKITDRKKEIFKTSGGKYIAPQVMENKLKESPFVEQIIVIGENRHFPAALIVPNFEHLRKWCEHKGIAYTTDAQMAAHEAVVAKFDEEINKVNENFGNWEKIKKFRLLPTPFGIESGELTPTLKLKRKSIYSKYEKLIEQLYA